jgi:HAD superfamily hydrolase (TIGR01509 family)
LIEAVVFDFDGLIFDSESHEYATVCEMFARHGAEIPLAVWAECIGREPGFFDPCAYLEERVGRPLDREALQAWRHTRFRERIAGEPAMPGVEAALTAARRLGLKVGLASSSSRAWVEGQLAALGLLDRFDCIRTRDDVARVKPDPELYRSVLACLDTPPEFAVAFEDSPNGALAAWRAGLYCVVVPNPVTAGLRFGPHHRRLDSFAGQQLGALLAALVAAGAPAESFIPTSTVAPGGDP